MTSRAALKTYSWAFVSFFVILALDLCAHTLLHGTDGFGRFFGTAALGTALACAGKSPVYWWHERLWDRPRGMFGRREGVVSPPGS